MLRLKLIACKALYREFSLLTAACSNFIDATYIRQGLHDTPQLLARQLQEEINAVDAGVDYHTGTLRFERDFDAILLGYGLCSNGIIGLSSAKYKIVVPRTDDCIALVLGSYRRYKEYFDKHCGTYWYTPSWIESAYTPSEKTHKSLLDEYTQKYGEDNAKYLLEAEYTVKNYKRAAYAAWEELRFKEYEEYARQAADYFGWEFDRVQGDKRFLEDFIEGNWDARFLVVQPGQKIEADYNGRLIRAVDQSQKHIEST